MQFIAYSNKDIESIKQNSPKAAAESLKIVQANNSGEYVAPSLANALSGQVKPGSFADKMKAKQNAGD